MTTRPSSRPSAARLTRRRILTGGLAVAAVPFAPSLVTAAFAKDIDDADGLSRNDPRAFGFPEPDMTSRIVRPMTFPVQGSVSWTDTYGACRSGCSRRHEGQDIMGTKMQKLIACVSGTVVGYKHSGEGNYLFLRDNEGWHYGYLHINNDTPGTDDGSNQVGFAFAPGVTDGATVTRGQVIAYLGDSGNAEETVPHLHFEIRKPASAWYSAQAINAKYSLDAAGSAPSIDPATFTPWSNASDLVKQQYRDFLNREPGSSELNFWVSEITSGRRSPASLIAFFMASAEFQAKVAPVVRLYFGYFRRLPDTGGILYWIDLVRQGWTVGRISQEFARSREFVSTYGSLNDSAFIDLVYNNVLARTPDPAGKLYWVDRLNGGLSRGSVMANFTESAEYRAKLTTTVQVCMTYVGMLRRSPDGGGFLYWVDQIDRLDVSPLRLIQTVQYGSEYAGRF